jgi:hypothetical protein
MGNKVKHSLLLLISVLSITQVFGQSDLNKVNINGFGTLSYVRSDTEVPYNGSITNKNNFNYDTKAGVTLNKSFTSEWDFTLQFLAEVDERGDIQPNVDILQVVYRPISELSIRAGRFRLPLWMISEYLDVGVLIPWIRPPDEVYSSLPIDELNGLNATYNFDLSNIIFDIDVYTGTGSITTEGDSAITGELNNVIGMAVSANYEFLTFRGSYSQGSFTSHTLTNTYISPNGVTCPNQTGITCELTTKSELNLGNAHFTSLGLKSEWGNTYFMGEYATWKTASDLIKESQAYYILGGYYFLDKRLLTHVTMSRSTKVESQLAIYQGRQKSYIFGVNYSANQNVMLKLDFRQVNPEGIGFFASDINKDKAHIWGAAVDFVF